MKTIAVYLGDNNYATTNTDGRHQWIIDEPVDKGGLDSAPDPFSVLLSSLGSCTAITLKMYANRKGWKVDGIEVALNLVSDNTEEGRVSTFTSTITVKGELDKAQLQRLAQIARACPVSRLLEGKITLETTLKQHP